MLLSLLAQPTHTLGQLQAGPTLLEIGPEANSTRVTLRNTDEAPIAAQVRVYAWSQVGGEDRLDPTEDLVVSPPILELPAGGEQIVRVVRLGPPADGSDRSYRVVVDELPRSEEGGGGRVNLRLRYVIPAFVRAPGADPPSLSCRLEAGDDQLACENSGGRAAQLGASRLLDDRDEILTLSEGLLGYVLPGSRRVWARPSGPTELAGRALRLDTQLNGHPTALSVGRAP